MITTGPTSAMIVERNPPAETVDKIRTEIEAELATRMNHGFVRLSALVYLVEASPARRG
jgi:hypothetical protein